MNLDAASLFSVRGRTALVTGAAGFLGRTMVRGLLANGARVIAAGRSERLAREVTAWQSDFGADAVEALRVDMYDLDALAAALDALAARPAAVDVIVNNAHELGPATGFNVPEGTLELADHAQWMRHFTGGVYWPALIVQKLGPAMRAQRRGSIINVASMYAAVAPSPRLYEGTSKVNPPGYSASKAALVAFTRYVASYWGPHGIRANALLPGAFSNTEDATANAVAPDDPFLRRLADRTALGRTGRPSDLVGALLFLASDASLYVTGHALVVDGGWTIT